ncbi:glycerol-3-phosphate dehydrogenase/oxidase [Palleronia sediminis]|uniref:Glycerol-3-phosphate dehydrogenase/oxidase n=1 Tax=Palleronia sediminis TaxID=2547833 RepID=A0A4R6A647_9RHOB|nr:glycerol-3-phosphate dehydrogenase/oxidase [Palleronia sediminis]TDL76606.1 glycerol-3-phosphate dehydrogenase/oxidase [Palleronia sediminis]
MTDVNGDIGPGGDRGSKAPKAGGVFDLVVIGAGINGAGIARDAAARGLRVALVEKEDIGSGTSSWSGRLIHGGLRYLEQGDVALVRESLRERERLFRLAPHLVKPVPLMIPFYRHNQRSRWTLRAGMMAYDVLSFDKTTASHKTLSRRETLERFPGINPDGLDGCAIFMDGQVVWSERLCVEVVLAAHAEGAHIFTYAKVDGFLDDDGRVTGVLFTDVLTGERNELSARIVVNAAGPWVDEVVGGAKGDDKRYIGGAKGSHLIVNPFPGAPDDVVYYESRTDGRLVLIIPWGDRYLIGTTDKKFDDDPDTARADISEVEYLLGEVNSLVPTANLTKDDILYTYSGVRPLPYVPKQSEWKVPRSHVIHDHAPRLRGLLSIIGGKLTTYRSLAEETVDVVYKQLGMKAMPCTTAKTLFPGARVGDWVSFRQGLARTYGIGDDRLDRLIGIYGARAEEVLAIGREDPALLEIFDPDSGAIGAELVFTYRAEFCRTLTDALIRRIMVGLNATCGQDTLERAADILARDQGWSAHRREREIAAYRKYIQRFGVPGRQAPAAEASLAKSTERSNNLEGQPS